MPGPAGGLTYPEHPAVRLFRAMSEAEYAVLVDRIREQGQRYAIVIWHGQLLDGRHRLRACRELGIEPLVVERDDIADPYAFVVDANLVHRHLSEDQRAAMASRYANAPRGGDRDSNSPNGGIEITREQAAKLFDVSERQIDRARFVDHDREERLERGEESPVDYLDEVIAGTRPLADAVREVARARLIAALEDTATLEAKAAEGTYDVLVFDPPWPMQRIETNNDPHAVAFDYPTMSLEEITEKVRDLVHDHAVDTACHVWLWTTQKYLPAALEIFHEAGVTYVCTFVWHKPGGFQPWGLPQYNAEFALYGHVGAPAFVDTKAFPVCFDAPRTEHSEKPEMFYDVLRRVTRGRRLDAFNRRQIAGFDGWGKEAAV